MTDRNVLDQAEARGKANLRLATILGLVAFAFYIGFLIMSA